MGSANTLRNQLNYEVIPLKFGTSGRRGKVVDLTQLEIYTNVTGELEYLLSLESSQGGVSKGDDFYFAYDLRPSSIELVENGRGGIAQAVVQAVADKGLKAINLGAIPTPALTYYALSHGKGSIMVTGSHIPFDRNGYKLNTSKGELLKKDEAPINASVERVRERLLEHSANDSLFDEQGCLRSGNTDLLKVLGAGRDAYVTRYLDFFPNQPLAGLKLLVYQHSAVGRDVLVEILSQLGAKCTPAGRSSTFVPIDTEAVDIEQLNTIQKLIDETGQSFDAVVSTDGDSDRPLLVAPDGDANGNKGLRFFGGDLLGMIVAEYLGADAVVVPISSNDAIDRGALASVLEPKTKIGSPYVIAGMETATKSGRKCVCGWEANGGFLTASDIERDGNVLKALPTRDAVLPLLCVLSAARQRKMSVPELFATLPARFSRASLLRNFARSASLRILARFSQQQPIEAVKKELRGIFTKHQGFSEISRIDYTDGLRLIFDNGDVAHVRPSGNADELRIYAVADTQARADEIVEMGVKQPHGLLRLLEKVSSE
jgi:phosphomannomutase